MRILKFAAYLLVAYILLHWLTAGHDEIIEGPYPSVDSYGNISM